MSFAIQILFTLLLTLGGSSAIQHLEVQKHGAAKMPTNEDEKVAALTAWGKRQGMMMHEHTGVRLGKVEGMGNAFLAESPINASASSPVPLVSIPLPLMLGKDGVESTCWGREIVRSVATAIGELNLFKVVPGHRTFRPAEEMSAEVWEEAGYLYAIALFVAAQRLLLKMNSSTGTCADEHSTARGGP